MARHQVGKKGGPVKGGIEIRSDPTPAELASEGEKLPTVPVVVPTPAPAPGPEAVSLVALRSFNCAGADPERVVVGAPFFVRSKMTAADLIRRGLARLPAEVAAREVKVESPERVK